MNSWQITSRSQVQLGNELGRGTYGVVYAAQDIRTGRFIAEKQIKCSPGTVPDDDVQREVRALARLQHPNIVEYLGCHRGSDVLRIWMEYISGSSLRAVLKRFRSLHATTARMLTGQMLAGLEYLHGEQFVHHDIKPENALVKDGAEDNNPVLKLADFGTVQHMQQTAAAPQPVSGGQMYGTPRYWSPEYCHHSGRIVGPFLDVWAVGCTVVEMLTGMKPWRELADAAQIVWKLSHGCIPEVPQDIGARGQRTPAAITEFLQRCFTSPYEDRPSAAKLRAHPFILGDADSVDSRSPDASEDLSDYAGEGGPGGVADSMTFSGTVSIPDGPPPRPPSSAPRSPAASRLPSPAAQLSPKLPRSTEKVVQRSPQSRGHPHPLTLTPPIQQSAAGCVLSALGPSLLSPRAQRLVSQRTLWRAAIVTSVLLGVVAAGAAVYHGAPSARVIKVAPGGQAQVLGALQRAAPKREEGAPQGPAPPLPSGAAAAAALAGPAPDAADGPGKGPAPPIFARGNAQEGVRYQMQASWIPALQLPRPWPVTAASLHPSMFGDRCQAAACADGVTEPAGESCWSREGGAGMCFSRKHAREPYLRLDLGVSRPAAAVRIFNRADCCHARLGHHQVWVGSDPDAPWFPGNSLCYNGTADKRALEVIDRCGQVGRYVWVVLPGQQRTLHLQEVMVLPDLPQGAKVGSVRKWKPQTLPGLQRRRSFTVADGDAESALPRRKGAAESAEAGAALPAGAPQPAAAWAAAGARPAVGPRGVSAEGGAHERPHAEGHGTLWSGLLYYAAAAGGGCLCAASALQLWLHATSRAPARTFSEPPKFSLGPSVVPGESPSTGARKTRRRRLPRERSAAAEKRALREFLRSAAGSLVPFARSRS
eukprot:TRINITY_DN23701_c0_g2_i1.p1 TRINITY_DN23701_c0_g2~~TRINITY_DN23701_c0_g2_i1.p1  ORF type:complete len:877 (+),score=190.95 TRINITY_DN23701_c0_g2_i1:148-2778(+)